MFLAAFITGYGGLGSIERTLETRMNARFPKYVRKFVPPVVPPFKEAFPVSVRAIATSEHKPHSNLPKGRFFLCMSNKGLSPVLVSQKFCPPPLKLGPPQRKVAVPFLPEMVRTEFALV